MTQKYKKLGQDAINVIRGILMGGADAIPGVSGGTIALILGIYQRLVTAVSRIDRQLFKFVRSGRWLPAAVHLDLRFLLALGCGIGLGILSLGELMNILLTDPQTRAPTLAVFFGMIVSSSVLVGRMIPRSDAKQIPLLLSIGLAGAVSAFMLTGTPSSTAGGSSLFYVFACGVVAICAMILPGISGAYLLVILGLYEPLTGIARSIRRLDVTAEQIQTLIVFAGGCCIGIITFSKLLRWLLGKYPSAMMALLCGFMVGALRKIWPFQSSIPGSDDGHGNEIMRNVLPPALDWQVVRCLLMAIVGCLVVFSLQRIAQRFAKNERVETVPSRAG